MENRKMLGTKKLHMVDIRYYEGIGVEIEEEDKVLKAIVIEENGVYKNIVTDEVFPYFTRIPYSNYTCDHVAYGTKLFLHNKELLKEKGICYVEVEDEFLDEVKKQDYIDSVELEMMMVNSKLMFKDRFNIIEKYDEFPLRYQDEDKKRKITSKVKSLIRRK